jgi:hypothetical protein
LVGTSSLIGAGALVLSCGLILHFGTAVEIAATAAPSSLDGLGLTMLGLAYLPNAVLAAVGYLSGVGFEIGPGTYSPLATTTADLPGVPLLAAAPLHDGRTMLGLACLALPLLAGCLVARPGVRRLVTRADRVAAAGLGAVLTGLLLSGLAAVAHGGVGDGRWSAMGVPILLFGPLILVQVGIVAVLVAALTGWRTDPWRLRDLAGADVTEAADPPRRKSRRTRRTAAGAARTRSRRSGRTPPSAVPDGSGDDDVADPDEAVLAAGSDGAEADQPVEKRADQPVERPTEESAEASDAAAPDGAPGAEQDADEGADQDTADRSD